jgi:hypothetical protein
MSFERFMVSLMTVVVLVFDLHAHFITLDPQARSERSCAQRSSELAPEWLLQSALDTILRLLTKSGCSITHKGTLASMPLTLVWPMLSTSTAHTVKTRFQSQRQRNEQSMILAWKEKVTANTVKNCWRKSGLLPDSVLDLTAAAPAAVLQRQTSAEADDLDAAPLEVAADTSDSMAEPALHELAASSA